MGIMLSALQRAGIHSGMFASRVVCPYCHGTAEMVSGLAIYPHRPDLEHLNFWQCAPCDAWVGCHKPKTSLGYDGTEPLGRLANAELRDAKQRAHKAFDPLWMSRRMTRPAAYAWLARVMGVPTHLCHIGEFDVAQCMRVVEIMDERAGNERC